MQITKLFREYQSLIISVGILIASVLGIIFGVVPLVQKTIDMNDGIKSVSAEVDVLKNKVTVLESIDEASMRSHAQILLSAVPADKSLPTLLATLDGLAAQTGVSSGNFTLSKLGSLATVSAERLSADERDVGGNILPFTLNISGSFDQLRGFFASSVSVRRLVRVRTFDISFLKVENEASASANLVTATLGMDTFYDSLPTTIGAVGQPLTGVTSADEDVIAKVAAMQLLVAPSSPLPPPSGGPVKADPFSL
jgi:Tfp pilus assembly protein PilO